MTFKDLGVKATLTKIINSSKIEKPFPIKKTGLPDAISGKDILVREQTGSGKHLPLDWLKWPDLLEKTQPPCGLRLEQ